MLLFLPVAERMEKTMRVAILVASVALSACATPAQQASSNLESGLDTMIGQPVEVAVARLGEPIASAPMGTDTVYGWGHAFTGTELLMPTTGFIDAANAQGGVFPPPRRTVQNACVIRI